MSRPARFAIHRADGRSNAEVVLGVISGAEPGSIFTYAALATALTEGAARTYTTRDVQDIVRRLGPRLLRAEQRALRCVSGVGYRVAQASEHRGLALQRKQRADVQMERGLRTLQDVRWAEMDEPARKAHEATLMLVGTLWQQSRALERRQAAVEDAIRKLSTRVEAIEEKDTEKTEN